MYPKVAKLCCTQKYQNLLLHFDQKEHLLFVTQMYTAGKNLQLFRYDRTMMYVHYISTHVPHHAPPGATPWPSEMLPPATTAMMGLRRRAGNDSPYHAREPLAFAEPCL